jgi:integrase
MNKKKTKNPLSIRELLLLIRFFLFTDFHSITLLLDLPWTYRNLAMKIKLTIKTIKNLKPDAIPYEVIDNEMKGFLLRVQPSGIMTYYLSYRNSEGIKKRYKIGRHGSLTPQQARDLAIKLSAKFHSGIDIQAEKKQAKAEAEKTKTSTLEGFLENKYESWVKIEKKSGYETINRIKHNFKEFFPLPLMEINHFKVENWRTEKLKNGKSPISVNRDVVALRSCISKAVHWGFLDLHPLSKLRPIKTDSQKKVRYLSNSEEKQLRQALLLREETIRKERETANNWRSERGYPLYPTLQNQGYVDHLQPMIILSINTGLRRGELFNLTWNDIDLDRATLTVNGTTAKSGKTRHIPLNSEALSLLKSWKLESESPTFAFPGKNGHRMDNIKSSWTNLLKLAEINNFRWHDLRHHFASKLAMASVDLNTIRELLGHSDLTMTLRYAHLAPEHKANAVEKLINSNIYEQKT